MTQLLPTYQVEVSVEDVEWHPETERIVCSVCVDGKEVTRFVRLNPGRTFMWRELWKDFLYRQGMNYVAHVEGWGTSI